MSDNFTVVLYGANDVRIEKRPIPEIGDNEVLIKMSCVGICGSDVKLYTTGQCGAEDVLSNPIVMGHEGAGTVVKIGSKVSNLRSGDRVAIEPSQPCRSCEYCKRGHYNLCETPKYCSTKAAPGNLCDYYKHVADFCHKIPDHVSMEEGAAIQPLAITIHAVKRSGVKLGDRVVILGAGPIGVLIAMVCKAMGVSKILMTDVVESRLDTAKCLGVDHTLVTHRNESEATIVDRILATLGTRPEVTFDACGYGTAQRVALMVTKAAGVVLVVGIADRLVELPLMDALLREVDIRGSMRINNTYPAAIEAVASGAINLKNTITHHFTLNQTVEALEAARKGIGMKIIIHLGQIPEGN